MNFHNTHRICALVLAGLLILNARGWTMPPHPDLVSRVGTGLAVPACDRDRAEGNFDVRTVATWRRAGASAAATDTFRTLAILIRYSDEAASTPAADFDTLLFRTGTGSVRDFYLECSYGQLDLLTVNLPSSMGWLVAPNTAAYYANNEYGLGSSGRARELVLAAVAAADPLVDFSQYDNDNNGWVDVLMVIHTGQGAEFTGSTGDIWSHKWSISPQERDNVWISSYTMMPEYWASPGDITIGVFAHELGHGFGLPDLYDTDNSSRGIGRWSVMAGGSWNGILGDSPAHFDAWSKVQMGFVTPITPTSQMIGALLPQVETHNVMYKLWDGGLAASEYFLVENRQRVGFDLSLPGDGVLIWHIDDNVFSDNTQEWYPGHTSSGHYLVALEQADGLFQLEQSLGFGNSGDPFPGSTNARTFNSITVPSSLAYTGAVSFVSVSNISDSDSLMTADFSVSLISGLEDDVRPEGAVWARNYPNPFNAGTRIEVNMVRPGTVSLDIYDLLGRRVKTFESKSVQAGTWQWLWDGTDESGVSLASGVYWYKVETPEAAARGRMVLLK